MSSYWASSPRSSAPWERRRARTSSRSSTTTLTWCSCLSAMAPRIGPARVGSEPGDRRGAEVREVVLRPEAGVTGEAVTVFGPGLRGAPGLVGDTGQARKQLEGEVVEVGDGLGPDRGFHPGHLCGPFCAEDVG